MLAQHYGIKKDELLQKMSDRQIDCRPFFHPLSSIPAYAHLPQADEARALNRVAYEICPYGLNLPSGLNLTRDNVTHVCNTLKNILSQ